jgi:hypothetical protein
MDYIYNTGEKQFSHDFITGRDWSSMLQMACKIFTVLLHVVGKKPNRNIRDTVITKPSVLTIIWNTRINVA